ncbi:MAG: TetR family transcriptional regulator [Pseudonocardiaceae bacterium]|nr:TetR family transcriptional regulator [Pseudonocardiaceae bacterium]
MIADSAIATLAREGMRGLTHRAVDRAAALPEGSTSYYFRTREALLVAALARMAELDTLDIGDLPELSGGMDLEMLTTLVTALVLRWLTDGRERTLARYELTLESTRRPELRDELLRHGSAFQRMAELTIAAAGGTEPERRGRALMSYVDGLVLHQLTRVDAGALDEHDLRAACRDLLLMALR